VPSQWEGQKFDPHCSHILTDLFETQNQERYPGYDPACKIWLMWDDGKGACKNGEFWLTVGSFFFSILRVESRSHSRTDYDQWGLKTRVSAQGSAFWGSRQ